MPPAAKPRKIREPAHTVPIWMRSVYKGRDLGRLSARMPESLRHLAMLSYFPAKQEVILKNGVRIVLKALPPDAAWYNPFFRFAAFPHPAELKKHPALSALKKKGLSDATDKLAGGLMYIRAWFPTTEARRELIADRVIPKGPMVVINDIQMRAQFAKLKPNSIRKKFWHCDDMLISRFETHSKAGGIKSIVVEEPRNAPPTQRQKLYHSLLADHGYAFVKGKKSGQGYWVKEL